MKLKTTAFELCNGKYKHIIELARATGTSVSQIYLVKGGKRIINEKFITEAIKAFPGYKLDDFLW